MYMYLDVVASTSNNPRKIRQTASQYGKRYQNFLAMIYLSIDSVLEIGIILTRQLFN